MLKTMTMIVIGGTLALLALTPATEARKAGGTQQEYKKDPDKARAITKPTDKATPLQGRTTKVTRPAPRKTRSALRGGGDFAYVSREVCLNLY